MARVSKPLDKLLAPELGMDPNNLSQDDQDKIEIIRDVVFDWLDMHENRHNVSMASGWREVMENLQKMERRGDIR